MFPAPSSPSVVFLSHPLLFVRLLDVQHDSVSKPQSPPSSAFTQWKREHDGTSQDPSSPPKRPHYAPDDLQTQITEAVHIIANDFTTDVSSVAIDAPVVG